jgi:hypothetical protein
MANLTHVRIKGVDYKFWSYDGVIAGVRNRSETQVWSSGGGGYVDPQYGGVVHAPTVHSHTEHWKEVRLDGDDGKGHSFTLPDYVSLFPGDRASIVYAMPATHKIGYAHGVFNYREDQIWGFKTKTLVKPEYRQTVGGYVMRFWSKGLLSWVAATMILALLDSVRMYGPAALLDLEWMFHTVTAGLITPQGLVLAGISLAIGTIVWTCTKVARHFSAKAAHKAIIEYARSLPREQTEPARVAVSSPQTVPAIASAA